jgi:uncharacterized protein (DUF488 family)
MNTVSISGNRGQDANYIGKCYLKLAPKLSFWRTWYDNIGKINEIENNTFYIKEYYNQVLSKLSPQEVYEELDNSVLLCYEDNNEFCHRHIIAKWLELSLGIYVPEIKLINNEVKEVSRPKYIGNILESLLEIKGYELKK